jgi:hypothetical protein
MQRIFWLSFILLFAEILAVRWLGIEVPIIRVFPNLVIMVCLVAASAGISKANAPTGSSTTRFLIVLVAALLLICPLIFAVPLGLPQLSLKMGTSAEQSSILLSLGVMAAIIVALYTIFQCIGTWLGKEFDKAPPLSAYSFNLLGSIAGTLTFAMICWLGLAPWVWILIAGAVTFFLYKKPAVPILTALLAAATFSTTNASFWSPYSKLDITPLATQPGSILGNNNYVLNSNNYYFHFALRMLNPEEERKYVDEAARSVQGKTVWFYYQWLKLAFQCAPKHDRVLVLGAGSGNDVAFALANGAKEVTAVEIDPIIAKLGSSRHPNKPYADPRVSVRNEDARTFLRYSKDKFDLVEFAFLDPGATINSASFLRVDNYVYTVESIKAALKLIDKDGVVCITFATGPKSDITARLYESISQANGAPPLAFTTADWNSVIFLFGPGAKSVSVSALEAEKLQPYKPASGNIVAATDQWPFLYLSYDPSGVWLYVIVLAVAIVLPACLLLRGGGTGISGGEWANMFFLGQAFMLMETKSITHLSLLLGATWIVSSAVITTVLLFAWLANLAVAKKLAPPVHVLYCCLLAALLLQYFVAIPESTTLPAGVIAATYCFLDCLPILFGSMIFSSCFGKTKFSTQALSANLLGVSIGGLTENLCLLTGTTNLVFVALLLYGLSFLALLRSSQTAIADAAIE